MVCRVPVPLGKSLKVLEILFSFSMPGNCFEMVWVMKNTGNF